MNFNTNIFYGLSGTLKTTTIDSLIHKPEIQGNNIVMWSGIKPWKELENGIFSGKVESNDLIYAINHLTRLEEYVGNCWVYEIENLFVERGVSDMLFYRSMKTALEDEFILDVIDKEEELTFRSDFDWGGEINVKRTLLIMEDKDFISKSINAHPSRQLFKDVDDFLAKQKDYVEFTKKYNNIDETITITSAKDYLVKLGIVYRSDN